MDQQIKPKFLENPDFDCSEQKYDDDHLFRTNWLLVDQISGLVLYSSMNHTVSGFDPDAAELSNSRY